MRFAHLVLLPAALLFAACISAGPSDPGKIKVVASSQIVGDVVGVITGDLVDVTFLIPAGTDPHAYEPAPQDATRLAEADLVFINGLGLEEALQPLLNDQADKVVDISEGVEPLVLAEEGESGPDPHVWTNPLNVKIWADSIARALAGLDQQNAAIYEANAEAYKSDIEELNIWAVEQIAQIPVEQRVLVTDHEAFGYFAVHYGFEIVGVVIPGYSTLSEPSAGDLAELETSIRDLGVKAIFVGVSLNLSLAEQVADDTDVQLVPIYTESLSETNGPAPTYLEMIRYDVGAIVAALKP